MKKLMQKYLNLNLKLKPNRRLTSRKNLLNLLKQSKNEEEHKIKEQHETIDTLKQIAKCTDCNMDMTQHTLKYLHKTWILQSYEIRARKNTRT